MEVVSTFCFTDSEKETPEKDLVRMLMELVTQRKFPVSPGELSPYDVDAIDARPVVRSFLLQLLLRHG